MATMFCILLMNHRSILVHSKISWAFIPRRRAAIIAQSLRSVGSRGYDLTSVPGFHFASSQRSDFLPNSSERTAFCRAASKVRSMAMTSPVAFIWVPMMRSPEANLSKGQRGILTTI